MATGSMNGTLLPRRGSPAPFIGKASRALILLAYLVGFWLLLPAGLWRAAILIDQRYGWDRQALLVGWFVVLAGVVLQWWGMLELRLGAGGLPVSAFPPPRFTRGGPYRYVRHPIYLGANVIVLGAGLVVGSRALVTILTPAFAASWIVYARVEERGLVRRFGSVYRRYQRQVGLFPRPSLYRALQVLQRFHVLDVSGQSGREHVPRRGSAILVFNHASYLDAALVGTITRRIVHHMTTAEVYRGGLLRWLLHRLPAVPVRRYRVDPVACRELLALLADRELVGIAPEGERAVLGRYQGALDDVASILSRLGVPVIPVGITGAYDIGPRWSDRLRRRRVRVRAGPPVDFDGREPAEAIDHALRALIDEDPQRIDLEGLPREKLERVLWRCPDCGDEQSWLAKQLTCAACGAIHWPTKDGWFVDNGGAVSSLASLGERVRDFAERDDLEVQATAWHERSIFGAIEPLERVGSGVLRVNRSGVQFGTLFIPLQIIRSTSTERANTLQVATSESMWQFRIERRSVFRLKLALDRWSKELILQERNDVNLHAGNVAESEMPSNGKHAYRDVIGSCEVSYGSQRRHWIVGGMDQQSRHSRPLDGTVATKSLDDKISIGRSQSRVAEGTTVNVAIIGSEQCSTREPLHDGPYVRRRRPADDSMPGISGIECDGGSKGHCDDVRFAGEQSRHCGCFLSHSVDAHDLAAGPRERGPRESILQQQGWPASHAMTALGDGGKHAFVESRIATGQDHDGTSTPRGERDAARTSESVDDRDFEPAGRRAVSVIGSPGRPQPSMPRANDGRRSRHDRFDARRRSRRPTWIAAHGMRIHDHPVLLKAGRVTFVTFGVFAAIGGGAGTWVALARMHQSGLSLQRYAWTVSLLFVVLAIIGSRIFAVLLDWKRLSSSPKQMLLETSFAWQGGFVLTALGLSIFALIEQMDLLILFDAIAFAVPLGQAIGRLGCLTYGCCHGRPTRSRFAVVYTNRQSKAVWKHGLAGVSLQPAQLYSAIVNLVTFSALMALADARPPAGTIAAAYLLMDSTGRYLLERCSRSSPSVRWLRRSPFEWVSIALFVAGAVLLGFSISRMHAVDFAGFKPFASALAATALFPGPLTTVSGLLFLAFGVHGPTIGCIRGLLSASIRALDEQHGAGEAKC